MTPGIYLSLPAVEIGLRHIAAVGIDTVHDRVMCLTGRLIDRLVGLRHSSLTAAPRSPDR